MDTPVTQAQAEVVTPMPSVRYAGFWLRVVAAIIDGILITIVINIISKFIPSTPPVPGTVDMTQSLWQMVLGLVYAAGMESSQYQATLGKMALGLKVTDMNGARLSIGGAVIRHVAKILSGITLGIGFLMAGFTAKKQALHDIVARTLVVRK